MSSKKTRVFKSLIAIFYYKKVCIKIYLNVLEKFKLLHMKCLISVTVNSHQLLFKKKERKNLYHLVKKKISYGKVLKDSFLRWMEFKIFVIYLNVYF